MDLIGQEADETLAVRENDGVFSRNGQWAYTVKIMKINFPFSVVKALLETYVQTGKCCLRQKTSPPLHGTMTTQPVSSHSVVLNGICVSNDI